jgi:hypothetical protein
MVQFTRYCPAHHQQYRPEGSESVQKESPHHLEVHLPGAEARKLERLWIHAIVGRQSNLERKAGLPGGGGGEGKEESAAGIVPRLCSSSGEGLSHWKVEFFSPLKKGLFCLRRLDDNVVEWDTLDEQRCAFYYVDPPAGESVAPWNGPLQWSKLELIERVDRKLRALGLSETGLVKELGKQQLEKRQLEQQQQQLHASLKWNLKTYGSWKTNRSRASVAAQAQLADSLTRWLHTDPHLARGKKKAALLRMPRVVSQVAERRVRDADDDNAGIEEVPRQPQSRSHGFSSSPSPPQAAVAVVSSTMTTVARRQATSASSPPGMAGPQALQLLQLQQVAQQPSSSHLLNSQLLSHRQQECTGPAQYIRVEDLASLQGLNVGRTTILQGQESGGAAAASAAAAAAPAGSNVIVLQPVIVMNQQISNTTVNITNTTTATNSIEYVQEAAAPCSDSRSNSSRYGDDATDGMTQEGLVKNGMCQDCGVVSANYGRVEAATGIWSGRQWCGTCNKVKGHGGVLRHDARRLLSAGAKKGRKVSNSENEDSTMVKGKQRVPSPTDETQQPTPQKRKDSSSLSVASKPGPRAIPAGAGDMVARKACRLVALTTVQQQQQQNRRNHKKKTKPPVGLAVKYFDRPLLPSRGWECAECTYLNRAKATVCRICNAAKGFRKASAPTPKSKLSQSRQKGPSQQLGDAKHRQHKNPHGKRWFPTCKNNPHYFQKTLLPGTKRIRMDPYVVLKQTRAQSGRTAIVPNVKLAMDVYTELFLQQTPAGQAEEDHLGLCASKHAQPDTPEHCGAKGCTFPLMRRRRGAVDLPHPSGVCHTHFIHLVQKRVVEVEGGMEKTAKKTRCGWEFAVVKKTIKEKGNSKVKQLIEILREPEKEHNSATNEDDFLMLPYNSFTSPAAVPISTSLPTDALSSLLDYR